MDTVHRCWWRHPVYHFYPVTVDSIFLHEMSINTEQFQTKTESAKQIQIAGCLSSHVLSQLGSCKDCQGCGAHWIVVNVSERFWPSRNQLDPVGVWSPPSCGKNAPVSASPFFFVFWLDTRCSLCFLSNCWHLFPSFCTWCSTEHCKKVSQSHFSIFFSFQVICCLLQHLWAWGIHSDLPKFNDEANISKLHGLEQVIFLADGRMS